MRRSCKSVVISVNVNNKWVPGPDLAPQLFVEFSALKTSAGLDVRIKRNNARSGRGDLDSRAAVTHIPLLRSRSGKSLF